MQVRSFDEAIKVTVQKYNYGEKQIKQVYEALENGNFNVITNDCGARNFVINYYNALNQTYTNNQNNNQDLIINDDTNLFEYFNKVLTNNQIDKQSPEVFKYLYNSILEGLQNPISRQSVEKKIYYSACSYSRAHQDDDEKMRRYYFDTPDITRKEAADLTDIYINMEHQKYRVYEAFYKYPAYQKQLISNLINIVYYETDYSKWVSLDDQIKAVRGW